MWQELNQNCNFQDARKFLDSAVDLPVLRVWKLGWGEILCRLDVNKGVDTEQCVVPREDQLAVSKLWRNACNQGKRTNMLL